MLENLVKDKEFAFVMQKNIQELIIYLFEKEQNFGIFCKVADATFNPELPEDINDSFREMTLFFLAGYTFETAHIVDDCLVFEAGFGAENIGSVVTIPLISIMQVIVDETPVLINLSTYKYNPQESEKTDVVDSNGIENSMSSFLSNPENAKFLKK